MATNKIQNEYRMYIYIYIYIYTYSFAFAFAVDIETICQLCLTIYSNLIRSQFQYIYN